MSHHQEEGEEEDGAVSYEAAYEGAHDVVDGRNEAADGRVGDEVGVYDSHGYDFRGCGFHGVGNAVGTCDSRECGFRGRDVCDFHDVGMETLASASVLFRRRQLSRCQET